MLKPLWIWDKYENVDWNKDIERDVHIRWIQTGTRLYGICIELISIYR